MEKGKYPQHKDPQNLSSLGERMMPQRIHTGAVYQKETNLQFRIHWALIFNIIMLIVDTWYFAQESPYFFKHSGSLFKAFLLVHHSLIGLNIIWHFMKDCDLLNKVILALSYTTFVFAAFSLLYTIAAINMEQDTLFEAIISLIFVNVPGALLGWSAWLLVKEHLNRDDIHTIAYTVPEQPMTQTTQLKAPQISKIPAGYVPVIINENGVAQIIENLA
ncbi:unnamed protein product [Moneuplotes crassus]|uniref:Uncharacterized protein n=1 Tax=Euplotes crassus TaxID=5936 RepID=A0AAD1XVJ3_EUPCR|nr:unnamed protein product [Moneuplotes crassus]